MKLKLIDHESVTKKIGSETPETTFTTLIFQRDDGQVLRAKTWFWLHATILTTGIDEVSRLTSDIDDLSDFATWIEKQDFPDDLDITNYWELYGVVEEYEEYLHMREVGPMRLRLIDDEVADEGTTLIFEKEDGELLRANTYNFLIGDLLGMDRAELPAFANWIAARNFPADLDITDNHSLAGIMAKFHKCDACED